jgi:hypothetical protein
LSSPTSTRLEILFGGCGLGFAVHRGGNLYSTVLADQDPGSAIAGSANCIQRSGDIGLLES